MAQDGFFLSDEGRTLTVLNDSGTTAIEAGDIVYVETNDDVLTDSASSARNAYSAGDVKVKSIVCSATGYQTVVGVAVQDIPADGYGAVAMEGVFFHQAQENIEAGGSVQAYEGTDNKLQALDAATATVGTDIVQHKIGRALTGGSADGQYIIWKLAL